MRWISAKGEVVRNEQGQPIRMMGTVIDVTGEVEQFCAARGDGLVNVFAPHATAGLALIALAIALFVIDVFAPTHGVLTAGGVGAFFLGTLLLFNRAGPGFTLSLAWIVPATIITAVRARAKAKRGRASAVTGFNQAHETNWGAGAESST